MNDRDFHFLWLCRRYEAHLRWSTIDLDCVLKRSVTVRRGTLDPLLYQGIRVHRDTLGFGSFVLKDPQRFIHESLPDVVEADNLHFPLLRIVPA